MLVQAGLRLLISDISKCHQQSSRVNHARQEASMDLQADVLAGLFCLLDSWSCCQGVKGYPRGVLQQLPWVPASWLWMELLYRIWRYPGILLHRLDACTQTHG